MRACWHFFRFGKLVFALILCGFAAMLPASHVSTLAQEEPCLPAEPRRSEDTISTMEEKSLAFEEVITPGGIYEEYDFGLDTTSTPPGAIVPVLSKSIAGIENTSWYQYDEADTTVVRANTDGSCDYGLMQVNSGQNDLFSKTPSLRSDTRGNIAAGTEVLAQKWDEGVPGGGDVPVVNDTDPELLIHWYYALSAYNGGPSGNTWVNNPNCGQDDFRGQCLGSNFAASRSDGATWDALSPRDFPYQERVLYNLEYPRFPEHVPAQWVVGQIGLLAETSSMHYGIRPDDALFRTEENTSLAPNILLFQHYPPTAYTILPEQPLTFAFDLPLAANVTIEVLDAADNTVATLVDKKPFPAGWSTETRPITVPILPGYAYRIFAERGTAQDVTTWYVGQYTQDITRSNANPPLRLYLALILGGSIRSDDEPGGNLVRNGDFSEPSPLPDQATQPAYWQVQTMINTEDGRYSEPLEAYTAVVGSRMQLRAAPRARQEIRQRVALPPSTSGDHGIVFEIEVADMPPNSQSRLEVRYRSVKDGQVRWESLSTYTIDDNGMRAAHSRTVSVESSAIILSFLATFDAQDATTRFLIDDVQVRRSAVECVPGEPCGQLIGSVGSEGHGECPQVCSIVSHP